MTETPYYDFHIFCCINDRGSGHKRGCCASKGAEALLGYFKDEVKKHGIKRVRVNKSGCLDRCEFGPAMVVYPEGVWYQCKTKADIDQVIEQHLRGGIKVGTLTMPARNAAS